ncbi:MAG: hypothetical protein ACXVAX_01785 [Pseudobdellovibrio sp.]
MKKKLILLIATLTTIQSKSALAVDNPLGSVEKEYQHELICEGVSRNEAYKLTIQWNPNSEFQYELKNVDQNSVTQDSYQDFFGEHESVTQSDKKLQFSGNFNMWKRLGYIAKTTNINLNVESGVYSLESLKNTYLETFNNPKNWCNPPTRLCGSEPISQDPEPQVTELKFEHSQCQLVK